MGVGALCVQYKLTCSETLRLLHYLGGQMQYAIEMLVFQSKKLALTHAGFLLART